MLPKLLTLLGVILQVGQVALDAYVHVREVFPRRKARALSELEIIRLRQLQAIRGTLSPRDRSELVELNNRHYSQE